MFCAVTFCSGTYLDSQRFRIKVENIILKTVAHLDNKKNMDSKEKIKKQTNNSNVLQNIYILSRKKLVSYLL